MNLKVRSEDGLACGRDSLSDRYQVGIDTTDDEQLVFAQTMRFSSK